MEETTQVSRHFPPTFDLQKSELQVAAREITQNEWGAPGETSA